MLYRVNENNFTKKAWDILLYVADYFKKQKNLIDNNDIEEFKKECLKELFLASIKGNFQKKYNYTYYNNLDLASIFPLKFCKKIEKHLNITDIITRSELHYYTSIKSDEEEE